MKKEATYEGLANLLFNHCSCGDDSGSCEWCYIYYGLAKRSPLLNRGFCTECKELIFDEEISPKGFHDESEGGCGARITIVPCLGIEVAPNDYSGCTGGNDCPTH